MKIIVLILISSLFYYSCSYPLRKGYEKTEYQEINVFKPDFKKAIYHTSIDIYKKHFSGLLVIKKIEQDSTYRLVFLSELGMKIFDFEYSYNYKNDFQVKYILEPINKKYIINTLKQDFELFLKTQTKETKTTNYKKDNIILQKVKYKGMYNYYTFSTDSNYVSSILQKGWLFKKVLITNKLYSKSSPNKTIFNHKGVKLSINLSKID